MRPWPAAGRRRNGRDFHIIKLRSTDLAERVRYDLHYLENWSLWLDFQIMVQTFLKRDNAY